MSSAWSNPLASYIGSWLSTFQGAWSSWQRGPQVQAPPVQTTVQKTPQAKLPDPGFTWDDVKDKASPYPNPGMDYDDFKKTFGFWFNYFWEEARQCAEALASPTAPSSPGELGLTDVLGGKVDVPELRRNLCVIFGEVFTWQTQASQNPQVAALKTIVPRPGVGQLSDDQKLNILVSLLVIGFKPYPLSKMSAIQDSSPLFTDQIVYGTTRQVIQLGFRADSRPWQKIHDAGGCKRRVDADDQRNQFALDKPWHPFYLEDVRECLWFRRGAKNLDNCLHSVVSVGPKFSEIIQFPKLSDGNSYPQLSREPFNKWESKDVQYAQTKNIKCVDLQGNDAHLETETSIYVFKVNGMKVYDTQAQQKVEKGTEYTERGAQAIPSDNLLARIVVTRRHKNGAEEFHLKSVHFQHNPKWEPLSDENELKGKLFGSQEAYDAFKQFMDRLTNSNPIANEQRMETVGSQSKDALSSRGGYLVKYTTSTGEEKTLTVQSTNDLMAANKAKQEVRKLGGTFVSITKA